MTYLDRAIKDGYVQRRECFLEHMSVEMLRR